MKRLFSIIIIFLTLFTACRTIQYVPIKGDTVVEYRDTTVYKDSIVFIPKETIKEVVPALDTLTMETSMAKATAWLDTTTTTLRGALTNKKGVEYKYAYKDKLVYRDSISIHEVPVEVPVETIKYRHTFWDKLSWLISGISISIFIIYILRKIYAKR